MILILLLSVPNEFEHVVKRWKSFACYKLLGKMIWFSLSKAIIVQQLRGKPWSDLLPAVTKVREIAADISNSSNRIRSDCSQSELILQADNSLD